jgi:DNA-binding beta-propeller fold protein YncE
MAVSPDGSRVFVTGDGRKGTAFHYATVAYAAATGARLWVATNFTGGALAVAVSPDGTTVFVTGQTTTAAYSAASGALQWSQPVSQAGGASQVAVSPNGQEVLTSGYNNNFQDVTVAYDAASGATLWTRHIPSAGSPAGLLVSPDGFEAVLAGSGTKGQYQTVAYALATGGTLWTRHYRGPFPTNMISSAVISPDGSQVVVTGLSAGHVFDDATVAYDAATGAKHWTRVTRSAGAAPALAISPDGARVFLTGGGKAKSFFTIRTTAYDSATGARIWTKTHGRPSQSFVARGIAVSPDGSAVYVTGAFQSSVNSTITLAYDAATGSPRWRRFQPDSNGVVIAADPNGSAVFVTGFQFSVQDFLTIAYSP